MFPFGFERDSDDGGGGGLGSGPLPPGPASAVAAGKASDIITKQETMQNCLFKVRSFDLGYEKILVNGGNLVVQFCPFGKIAVNFV